MIRVNSKNIKKLKTERISFEKIFKHFVKALQIFQRSYDTIRYQFKYFF